MKKGNESVNEEKLKGKEEEGELRKARVKEEEGELRKARGK